MHESAVLAALLSEGDGTSLSALDVLGNSMVHLEKLVRLDADLAPMLAQAEDLFEGVSDLARAVSDYGSGLEYDPQRLREIEERLALISQLQRKYGDTIADVLAFGESARAELALLSDSETRTEALEAQEEQLLRVIGERAQTLSRARTRASATLAQAVETELAVLRMAGTRFKVEIRQKRDDSGCYVGDERFAFDATGIDQIQFLVSANPGEPLRPLAKVASGGETARLMLALKNVLSQADATPTLIFDEIDQGIGGRVGAIVGQKLLALAAEHQVLCVTHLPQIAAYGHKHLQVSKQVAGQRTISQIRILEGEERVDELAAMLGAESDSGRQSAQELLAAARAA
jgi:DNA repair protein RecN (Recombination protein N)